MGKWRQIWKTPLPFCHGPRGLLATETAVVTLLLPQSATCLARLFSASPRRGAGLPAASQVPLRCDREAGLSPAVPPSEAARPGRVVTAILRRLLSFHSSVSSQARPSPGFILKLRIVLVVLVLIPGRGPSLSSDTPVPVLLRLSPERRPHCAATFCAACSPLSGGP